MNSAWAPPRAGRRQISFGMTNLIGVVQARASLVSARALVAGSATALAPVATRAPYRSAPAGRWRDRASPGAAYKRAGAIGRRPGALAGRASRAR